MRVTYLLCGLFLFVTITALEGIAIAESDLAPLLKGLTGVGVEIVYVGDNNWNVVSKQDIQTEVELRLRRSGIKVYPYSIHDPYIRVVFAVYETVVPSNYMLLVGIRLN
jgi:hypothetical protein